MRPNNITTRLECLFAADNFNDIHLLTQFAHFGPYSLKFDWPVKGTMAGWKECFLGDVPLYCGDFTPVRPLC